LTIAIYPGTFDPITNGHLDIATRAASLFEKLIIGVYDTPNKRLLFTTNERVELVRKAVAGLPNVEVKAFPELTVNFARKVGAKVMVRGLRAGADFEREFEMAMLNNKLSPELELICLMSKLEYQFLSSSLLKETASLGGNVKNWVPRHVSEALRKKIQSNQ